MQHRQDAQDESRGWRNERGVEGERRRNGYTTPSSMFGGGAQRSEIHEGKGAQTEAQFSVLELVVSQHVWLLSHSSLTSLTDEQR